MRRRMLETFVPGERTRRFARLLLFASLVGVISGLGSIVFQWLLGGAGWVFLDYLAGFRPEDAAGEASFFGPSLSPFRPSAACSRG